MRDFYADFPFAEVVLKIADAEKFCSVGDMIAGMAPESGIGRVERFVDGGILVHPTRAAAFVEGDTVVSPTATRMISEIGRG